MQMLPMGGIQVIVRTAKSGSLESNDALVFISPGEDSIELEIESPVKILFGKQIEKLVYQILEEKNIDKIKIKIIDKGALECTLKARLISALNRASEGAVKDDWE